MRAIAVRHALGQYPVFIGCGLKIQLKRWLKEARIRPRLVIISHPEIMELHGRALVEDLNNWGYQVLALAVPSGEESKSIQEATRLYEELGRNYIERGAPMLALGGGVIGDLVGFVASTYMRGNPLIQLPTTLLAQVDSSIGGKTAVNCGSLKNQIGTFHSPRAVFADIGTLSSLAPREMASGLAEIMKSAIIGAPRLFALLEKHVDEIMALDSRLLEEAVYMAATVKAGIVSRDEREEGLRQVLNLGHSIGHAVETVTGFNVNHGQAVAMGTAVAGTISVRMGLMRPMELNRISYLFNRCGLPSSLPGLNPGALMEALKHDKKVTRGRLRFVLPVRVGQVVVRDVDPALVAEVLAGT